MQNYITLFLRATLEATIRNQQQRHPNRRVQSYQWLLPINQYLYSVRAGAPIVPELILGRAIECTRYKVNHVNHSAHSGSTNPLGAEVSHRRSIVEEGNIYSATPAVELPFFSRQTCDLRSLYFNEAAPLRELASPWSTLLDGSLRCELARIMAAASC